MVTRPTGPELKGACHTYEQFSSARSRAKLERVRLNARLWCWVSTQDFIKRGRALGTFRAESEYELVLLASLTLKYTISKYFNTQTF